MKTKIVMTLSVFFLASLACFGEEPAKSVEEVLKETIYFADIPEVPMETREMREASDKARRAVSKVESAELRQVLHDGFHAADLRVLQEAKWGLQVQELLTEVTKRSRAKIEELEAENRLLRLELAKARAAN